jgi:hypothetical protein
MSTGHADAGSAAAAGDEGSLLSGMNQTLRAGRKDETVKVNIRIVLSR